jgi:hypothetical protein
MNKNYEILRDWMACSKPGDELNIGHGHYLMSKDGLTDVCFWYSTFATVDELKKLDDSFETWCEAQDQILAIMEKEREISDEEYQAIYDNEPDISAEVICICGCVTGNGLCPDCR